MSTDEAPKGVAPTFDVGTLARDAKHDRVGIVMGKTDPYVQLRLQEGGLEWDVRPEHLRAASASETLSTRVREANERSTGGTW